jgi:hypothetical protein
MTGHRQSHTGCDCRGERYEFDGIETFPIMAEDREGVMTVGLGVTLAREVFHRRGDAGRLDALDQRRGMNGDRGRIVAE